ncbi:hypothetical protein PMZ80_006176 [Knufia obscura]|uniref:F-box domain-containing protein n=2 Tax=Knufia TaxID=430999 RepID=A0AAN8I9W8_9EURO|nr:hypothetical protein PMZ80_006176 [Knufia obscura]KAK5954845.1 hypothetical protein OHC33_004571 [Knufia fluminis]
MKIIEFIPSAQNVTYLPDEVLDLVISYVQQSRSPKAAQRDLWSCCLVSRDWYATAVKHLYQAPVISSRNFGEFARTLSPPVASRSRRIGLEDFVQYLDIGMLAYESKKSTTSRLISRTKSSLRSFTAPAVSFSMTCLAPLSKCMCLQQLDLSRDEYDFDLSQLMRSIKAITSLAWLNLPKNCLTLHYETNYDNMARQKAEFWPPSLTFLQLNESHMHTTPGLWNIFLNSLPHGLESLALRNNANYDPFDTMARIEASLPQIRTLSIDVHRSDDTYYFNHLTQPFPNVTKVTVPAMTSWLLKNFLFMSNDTSWSVTADRTTIPKPPRNLEVLVLEESADWPTASHIRMADLKQFVELCPKLLRIDVPGAYINLDDDDDMDMDDLNEMLVKRVQEMQKQERTVIGISQTGVFATERAQNAGPGMKRSFRYRANG